MLYSHQENTKNCFQSLDQVFCSVAKNNLADQYATFISGELKSPGTLLQFFDLKETLLRKKIIKFYAKGICMYPSVRPGDILHIESKRSEEMLVGDIAVYRQGNSLFGHRVMDKGNQEGWGYIMTRPDTVSAGSDGPIFNKDIAGIVIGIERKKRIWGPEKIYCSLIHKILLKFLNVCFKIKCLLVKKFIYPITLIQYCLVYRKISKLLFFGTNKNINFSIQVPSEGYIGSPLKKMVSLEELFSLKNQPSGLWFWEIVLNFADEMVASLAFTNKFKACSMQECWLSELKIKHIYRGSAIEEKIFEKADELLTRLGVSCVLASVFKRERLNMAIFAGLGFKTKLGDTSLTDDYIVLERMIKH